MLTGRWLGLLALSPAVVRGLVTLENVRSLTNVTWESTKEIVASGLLLVSNDGYGQLPLQNMDDSDVEDVVAGALRYIDSELLEMMNVPMSKVVDISNSPSSCPAILNDYHNFMSSTTHFLRSIDEKQQQFRWSSESPVFDGLSWMQSLWASRKSNAQQLSFIEQQTRLYASSGCFEKGNEVLKRDVEVVEYMNDLIDSFE